jgi:hypothetical protein
MMWNPARFIRAMQSWWARQYTAARDLYYGRWGSFRSVDADDIPDDPEPGLLYLVGDSGRYWIAAMRCPCGCSDVLEMNLLPDAKPVWHFQNGRGNRPTLHPSVWRRDGCRAHFFLRDGRIRWS